MQQVPIEYTEYKNGFTAKLKNRRIKVLKEEDKEEWLLVFRNYHDKLLTKKEKKNYTGSFDRFNRTVTDKLVRLSDEAFKVLSELSFRFLINENK